MKEKTIQDLYNAIHSNILGLRIDIQMGKIDDVDAALFHLVEDIWKEQSKILRIDG